MSILRALTNLKEKCDIYFEDSLISQELIIEKYIDFFASAFSGGERSVGIILHTGSICFDVISVIAAALACISLDGSDTDSVIDSLNIGDMVLYGKNKNERYFFGGFYNGEYFPFPGLAANVSIYCWSSRENQLGTGRMLP